MESLTNILKLLAGVGLFLFAMYLVEESLKNLSGRKFKIFLQRITKNRLGAVGGGALVTGILQSSSMVSLMVLAFVGAGVFTMRNAMAIIMGANLGTILSSWLVVSMGFKVNIEIAAYPAVCLGGILFVMFGNRKTMKNVAYFLFGFGLLFIALSFMKTAMEAEVKQIDLSRFASMPPLVFLLLGFVITLLVQSSSVTMALTLSALHAGAFDFLTGAAIVLGAETGTTIKIVLGAAGGSASKKRVAVGNFLFNVFLTLSAFLFLRPLVYFITEVLFVTDPLYGLVTFSSLINLLSILIFLPFLDPYAKFLERLFKESDDSASAFIGNAELTEPHTALDLFRRETAYFIENSMIFNVSLFELDNTFLKVHPEFDRINEKRKYHSMTVEEKYEFLKLLQGELQAFYLNLRAKLPADHSGQLNQLMAAVRSSMYSVKCMKDVGANISNLQRSSKDVKFDVFLQCKNATEELYHLLSSEMKKEKDANFESLHHIFDMIQTNYTARLNNFYSDAQKGSLEDLDMTIATNFNRELYTSNKAMLMAVKDFLLTEKEALNFNQIPVYLS
ncbi:MAG: Na/Pi symporter [bacterium]|nr:Na/Pi symporter [bacterium]